jgi:hypothetical protein
MSCWTLERRGVNRDGLTWGSTDSKQRAERDQRGIREGRGAIRGLSTPVQNRKVTRQNPPQARIRNKLSSGDNGRKQTSMDIG